jgi:hypothetical protein
MYNLNYTPTNWGVQSWREIISGGTRTIKVEYHWSKARIVIHLSNTGPLCSNSTWGMGVYIFIPVHLLSCVGRSPAQGVPPNAYKTRKAGELAPHSSVVSCKKTKKAVAVSSTSFPNSLHLAVQLRILTPCFIYKRPRCWALIRYVHDL